MADEKNPIIAAILSFFIAGLGQVYNGEMKKGLVLFAAAVLSLVVVTAGSLVLSFFTGGIGGCLCIPLFLVPLGITLFSIYDAYLGAQGKPAWRFQ